MKKYTVIFERDETGWWVASVREIPGCHTQGKTLEQAEKRIREALELFIDKPEQIELINDVHLPQDIQFLLNQFYKLRQEAEEKEEKSREFSSQAAKALTESMHLSLRDAGKLMGLSHQRVQQLVSPKQ